MVLKIRVQRDELRAALREASSELGWDGDASEGDDATLAENAKTLLWGNDRTTGVVVEAEIC